MSSEVEYVRALRRGWPLIAVIFGVALVTAFIVTKLQARRFQSSTLVVVAPSVASTETRDVIDSIEALERRTIVATFARLATTDVLHAATAAQLAMPAKRAAAYRVNATVVPNTNMIRIDTEGPDAKLTASFGNTVALATAREARNLYRVYAMRIVSEARPAPSPSYPDPKRNFLIAAMIGLALGAAAALALHRLTGGFRSGDV